MPKADERCDRCRQNHANYCVRCLFALCPPCREEGARCWCQGGRPPWHWTSDARPSEEQTASASADAITLTVERLAKAGKKGNSEARQGGKQLSGTEGVDARLNAALRRDKALAGWPMSWEAQQRLADTVQSEEGRAEGREAARRRAALADVDRAQRLWRRRSGDQLRHDVQQAWENYIAEGKNADAGAAAAEGGADNN